MPMLFTPITLREMDVRNRVVMPPMCQYSAASDGMANDWHLSHYMSRAVGGAGLIIMEATAVTPGGRITDNDLGIWSDGHVPMLRRIAAKVRSEGARVGIQIAHAGRKSMATESTPVAPSAAAFDDGYKNPAELSTDEIKKIVTAFAGAAKRAHTAGFDLVEIHAAHGYLLNEFISPITNKRRDRYGPTPEDRVRLLKEVIRAVREQWPEEKPVSVRISAIDYAPGGIELKDSLDVVGRLENEGVDIWHISSGGITPEAAPSDHPGYQVPYSDEIKNRLNVKTITVGKICSPEMAEEIVANSRADMVALGRELLRNPYWPLHAARKLGYDMKWPKQYERAKIQGS
ncbi:MAG: NADPH dehydrogenase NamA [Deltaproteobacteria bacterium]|nr:NADPH dehydrogenase NamA [Deltaproteobacteria bacterium]